MAEISVRLTAPADIPTIASLRAQWTGARSDPGFEARVRDWLIAEGDRRLIWLASVGGEPSRPSAVPAAALESASRIRTGKDRCCPGARAVPSRRP